jgi:hypothetical protein
MPELKPDAAAIAEALPRGLKYLASRLDGVRLTIWADVFEFVLDEEPYVGIGTWERRDDPHQPPVWSE